MRAVLLRPGEGPQVVDIQYGLEAFQAAVGGYIQAVPGSWSDRYTLYANEEGLLLKLPFNLTWGGHALVGPVLFVGPVDFDGDDTELPEATALALVTDLAQKRGGGHGA